MMESYIHKKNRRTFFGEMPYLEYEQEAFPITINTLTFANFNLFPGILDNLSVTMPKHIQTTTYQWQLYTLFLKQSQELYRNDFECKYKFVYFQGIRYPYR